MNGEEFIRAVNCRYAGAGLPSLDRRDLPELAKQGLTGSEPVERDTENPGIAGFLEKKRERVRSLENERVCASCGLKFVPASEPDLYLYCEMVAPPPEGYCPRCLESILKELDSRQGAENMRCCG